MRSATAFLAGWFKRVQGARGDAQQISTGAGTVACRASHAQHEQSLHSRYLATSSLSARTRVVADWGTNFVVIVNKHSGRIDTQSAPGQGSCVTLWLPIARREGMV